MDVERHPSGDRPRPWMATERPPPIDPHDPASTRYWCRRLGCDAIRFRDAVSRVGPDIVALGRALS